MAKKRASSKAKKAAKTTAKVAVAGYAWRLGITGNAAKRKAQKNAVRSDFKRVGRGSAKVANTKAGKTVRATKAGALAERGGRGAVAKTKSIAGSGPGQMAKNMKKSAVSRKPTKKKTVMAKNRTRAGYQAGKHNLRMETSGVTNTKTFKSGKAVGGAKRSAKSKVKGAKQYGSETKFGYKVARKGQPTDMLLYKRARGAAKVGKAVNHVGANKGKYAAGAAVGVAAGAGAAYAYKRRKAKKAVGPMTSKSATYKRRTKSGKTITVQKGVRKKTGQGIARLGAYGSTRYTSKGAKNSSRLKGAATTWAGSAAGTYAGMATGAAVGYAATRSTKGAAVGTTVGQYVGNSVGGHLGRKRAVKKGYIRQTKKRMTVRAVNGVRGKR